MASNYRPVSLTSIACKLLEHIVLSSIIDHFDRHRVLCDEQHGFRVKRSCESQLLITIDDIARNMEEGDQTDIILLDFAKAFDKVPHDRLLHKIEFHPEKCIVIRVHGKRQFHQTSYTLHSYRPEC